MVTSAAVGLAAGAPGTTTVDKKKVFCPTKWKAMVFKYNDQKINGQPRSFPERLLLGADETLIRMDDEQSTRMFTPVGLGEILARRIYTAYDTMNKNSKSLERNDRDFHVTVSDSKDGHFSLHGQKKQDFEPNSAMLIIDGAIAAGWAKKLFEVGGEPHIDQYITWYTNNVRANPDKLWQLKELWEAAEWDISLKLRGGETFEKAMEHVMRDPQFKNDILNKKPPEKGKGRERSRNWLKDKKEREKAAKAAKYNDASDADEYKDKKGKGKGGKGKGGKGKKGQKDKRWWQENWNKKDENGNRTSWKNMSGWRETYDNDEDNYYWDGHKRKRGGRNW